MMHYLVFVVQLPTSSSHQGGVSFFFEMRLTSPASVSPSAHYEGMSGSFLGHDPELHRPVDQYILG